MKKIVAAIIILTMVLSTSITTVLAFERPTKLPTIERAMKNGKVHPKIRVSHKVSEASPWVYADVKLEDMMSSPYGKDDMKEVSQNIYDFFIKQKKAILNGAYCIILNNGYVVDKDTLLWRGWEYPRIIEKETKKDFYKGDTLFRIGFLYDNNLVEKTTYWKLIDSIDLPAGSTHNLNKKYTVGTTKSQQVEIGQTFGLKVATEVTSSAGFEYKFGSMKASGSMSTELNRTSSNTFKDSREITSLFESNTNVSYAASDKDRIVLRYQLVDNYKIEADTFKKATQDLENAINKNGKLAKLVPVGNNAGIEVPSDEVFDVSINKEDIKNYIHKNKKLKAQVKKVKVSKTR